MRELDISENNYTLAGGTHNYTKNKESERSMVMTIKSSKSNEGPHPENAVNHLNKQLKNMEKRDISSQRRSSAL